MRYFALSIGSERVLCTSMIQEFNQKASQRAQRLNVLRGEGKALAALAAKDSWGVHPFIHYTLDAD